MPKDIHMLVSMINMKLRDDDMKNTFELSTESNASRLERL